MHWRSMLAVSMVGAVLLAACGGSSESENPALAEPSVEPTLELTSLEQDYLFQISAAWDLFGTKAASFRTVFAQAWPTRERLFTALYDAGAGTAWDDSLAAVEKLEPPRRFHDDHEILLAGLAELVRIDAGIGESLKDDDLVGFEVLDSELGVASGLLLADLSPAVCEAVSNADESRSPCRSGEQLAGGEYGLKLELIMLRFEAQVGPRQRPFEVVLATEEEIIPLLDQTFSPLLSVTKATLAELSQLEPPEELLVDHEILVQYVTDQQSRVLVVLDAIEAEDEEMFNQLEGDGFALFCETLALLSEDALAIAHGHFAGDAPCSEILP